MQNQRADAVRGGKRGGGESGVLLLRRCAAGVGDGHNRLVRISIVSDSPIRKHSSTVRTRSHVLGMTSRKCK